MATGITVAILTAASITLWAQSGFSQSESDLKSLRKDVETLKEGQTAIQKELQEIKGLLRARPTTAAPAQEVVLSIDGAPFRGSKNAKVTLVEFTDYQ